MKVRKWSQCDGLMEKRKEKREPHPRIQEGRLTYETITKITTLFYFPSLLHSYSPSFLCLLSFSPLGPLSIALACVLLRLSRLSLKISGGGPLIASLISHVRRLRGFTGDVELLQIITCLSPFSPLLYPSLHPPFTVFVPLSIPLTHSPMI